MYLFYFFKVAVNQLFVFFVLRAIFLFFLGMVIVSCVRENEDKEERLPVPQNTIYQPPSLPTVIINQAEQLTYLLNHYWDEFDFADMPKRHDQAYFEQAFASYAYMLSQVDSVAKSQSVNRLMDRVWKYGHTTAKQVDEVAENYLANPNSPIRNEDSYIAFLNEILKREELNDIDKLRARELLRMIRKNRPGSVAADFSYITADNQIGSIHSIRAAHTILFFNNPGCEECETIKEVMINTPVFATGEELAIAAIYIDNNIAEWKATDYPNAWINAQTSAIDENMLYDLKAMPTLYLLDAQKRVILKDATLEQIATLLTKRITRITHHE